MRRDTEKAIVIELRVMKLKKAAKKYMNMGPLEATRNGASLPTDFIQSESVNFFAHNP